MRIEMKATLLGTSACLCVLALTFSLAAILRSSAAARSEREQPQQTNDIGLIPNTGVEAQQGRNLFARNCAHCHGDDARGDEGPSLYGLSISDARIVKKIKEGVPGEMPRFGGKFDDRGIAALVAFIRTLNPEAEPGQSP